MCIARKSVSLSKIIVLVNNGSLRVLSFRFTRLQFCLYLGVQSHSVWWLKVLFTGVILRDTVITYLLLIVLIFTKCMEASFTDAGLCNILRTLKMQLAVAKRWLVRTRTNLLCGNFCLSFFDCFYV